MRNLKRALSLALASVMLLGMMVVGSSAASYPDVDASNNLEAIEVLKMLELMEGSGGNFNPKENLTRYEMTALVCKLLGLTPGGNSPFTDYGVGDNWAKPYVAACYNNGIVSGTSATTFDGKRNVTAVEAGLMLMRTLNYFYNQSELGDNWKLSTIREANHIDLYRGINVYTDQILTRDDIAQMVLNALESNVVVAYQGLDINVATGDSNVNITGQWTYEPAQNNFSEDYRNRNTGLGRDPYMQLCEKLYGNDLKKMTGTNTTDAFCRPANQWRYNSQEVTTPIDSDVTYTAAVKGKQVYADLGNVDPTNYYVFVDGVEVLSDAGDGLVKTGFDIASGNEKKIGGNGVLTEVYLSYNDSNQSRVDVVMTRTFADEVNSTDKNTDGTYETYLLHEGNDTFDYATELEPGTVVLYTKTLDGGSVADDSLLAGCTTDKIRTMSIPEKFIGTVTRVKDSDNFDIEDKPYKYSSAYDDTRSEEKLDASSVDFDLQAYLDPYGYVIWLDNVDSNTNYAVATAGTNGIWTTDYQAKLFFPDGTKKEVDIKDANWADVFDSNKTSNARLVTYTKNSDGVYNLVLKNTNGSKTTPLTTVPAGDASKAVTMDQGKATLMVNGTRYVANAKTEFFVYDSTADEYYAWTGIKNFPGFDSGAFAYKYTLYVESGMVKAIYVESANDVLAGTGDVAAFFYVKAKANGDKNDKLINSSTLGSYYELAAVVDGKVTTVKVDVDTYNNTLTKYGSVVAKYKMNSDGIITSADVKTDTIDNYASLNADGDGYRAYLKGTTVTVERLKDDVIQFTSGGSESYSIAAGAVCFEYNKEKDEFISRSVKSLNDDFTGGIWIQIEDSMVRAVYYIK